jgi:tRNA G18 (ribose-2'-O)-methylase SpoU
VQDAGNVGTLLRIADWFGFDRVLLGLECADLFSQKVINASMGSFSRVRALTVDVAAALADQPESLPILGCDLEGRSVHELPPMGHVVVVIGSEGRRVFCFGRMERKERRGCGDAQGRTGSVMAKRGEQQAIKSPVHP